MRYGTPAAKFRVRPNGVDHLAIRPIPPDTELLNDLNLQGKLVIGFVGSFQFFSHLEEFFHLSRSLCQTFPNLIFLFVGTGNTAVALRRLSQTDDLSHRFLFTGTIEHPLVLR